MPGADLHAFHLDDEYLFRHYFEAGEAFEALREHYVRDAYRFEVPADDWPDVEATLRSYGFEPTVVEDPDPFCVVIGQYEPHADILRDSVANWTRREHRFLLLSDPLAVERALQQGATLVADSAFEAGI